MPNNLIHTFIIAGSVLGLFGIGEFLHHVLKIKAEYTRKITHTGTGFITLLCPLLLNDQWYVLGLCASFALLLILSLRYKFLNSINDIGRKSLGSLAYPVSVYLCFLTYTHYGDKIFFYLPMLILAIADPLAALSGNKWQYGKYRILNETKTLSGSFTFFLSACLITLACFYMHGIFGVCGYAGTILVISVASTLAESLTTKGLDNLTISVVVLMVLIFAWH